MDTIRTIKENDYQRLNLFWALAGEYTDARGIYPLNSSYVFERDKEILYCVGLWKIQDLPLAFAEGLIRNPNKQGDSDALKALQAHIENVALSMGCRTLIAISKNEGLASHHAKLGYNQVSAGAFMVKPLNETKLEVNK